jgi:hypothetical protein
MSVGGPSALGTLLVQRLDAALGTTLSQQANLVTGARPDAVTQAASPERADATRTETQRHPREVVERAASQAEQQGRGAIAKARLDARSAALLLNSNLPNTATTASAPTTLGQAARTILALLANFPEQAAVQGKRPLLQTRPNPSADARPQAASRPSNEGVQAAAGRVAGAGSGAQSPGPTTSAGVGSPAGAAAGSGGPSGPSSASAPVSGAPVAGTAPQATVAPAQLAQTLAQALQSSGMFYESHLANLAFGKQSLVQLMLEPQAQAGRPPGGGAQANASTAPGGEQAAARATDGSAQNSSPLRPGEAGGTQPGTTGTQTSTQHASALLASGMDPQTHLLVRQQLEVLANHTFAWRGEAWPDAPMEWEISRRDGEDDEAAKTKHWATRINIHLPVLGQVQAQLTLAGQQLVMHLVAPDSAGLLERHTETLRGRYSAQGLHLSQLSITNEEKAPGSPSAAGMDAESAEVDIGPGPAPETGGDDGDSAV